MSGPPWPPPPAPGSNSIGKFKVGISPIGDIVPFSYWNTILSQYANSQALVALIANWQTYIDQTQNFDALYDNIWDITTAQGYGLDVWGRILGVTRTLTIVAAGFFGFEEAGVSGNTFGFAPLYAGIPSSTNYQLPDNNFRTLLYAKALSNICNGSIPAINQILLNLFPHRGNCFVTDGLNMTMTYTFDFTLSPVEAAIVAASGVLPKPTGVLATVVQNA